METSVMLHYFQKKNLMISLCEPNDSYAPRGEDVEVHPEQQDSFGYSNISETFEILGNHWLHTSFLWLQPQQSWRVYFAISGISSTRKCIIPMRTTLKTLCCFTTNSL